MTVYERDIPVSMLAASDSDAGHSDSGQAGPWMDPFRAPLRPLRASASQPWQGTAEGTRVHPHGAGPTSDTSGGLQMPQESSSDVSQGGGAYWQQALQPDEGLDRALRPTSFQDFVGQSQNVHNLKVFIQAAYDRQEALDHVLLYGPPGLGKTTLAHLIAHHMQRSLKTSAGPVLTKPGDLAALLTQLQPQDVLFIDEIHRLPIAVEEMLYSAMEDYRIDILLGEGAHARALQLPLPPFTLVGATTRSGLLSSPLRDRFGIGLGLQFYTPQELEAVLDKACQRLGVRLDRQAQTMLAVRSRGTPRIALRLLRRLRDFAQIQGHSLLQADHVDCALGHLGINPYGLDMFDQRYLTVLAEFFQGGPAGLETLAAAMAESKDTLEDVIEPYLLQNGFVQRTPRGRQMTAKGWQVLGKSVPVPA